MKKKINNSAECYLKLSEFIKKNSNIKGKCKKELIKLQQEI